MCFVLLVCIGYYIKTLTQILCLQIFCTPC
uniref:Uncharacterized protein n=1 Tax=Arundo donax TaxID=35708 RepID=A0A0A9GL91_ARUDO